MTHIEWQKLPGLYTYEAYRQLTDELLAEGKTTGTDHSATMLEYTTINVARMRRWDKRSRLTAETMDALMSLDRSLVWLSITEAWCGDAAHILPVLQQMADAHPNIEHYLILRDEHLNIMDEFLTNGARAIPVTIVIDAETNQILGHWGPRPEVLQEQVMSAKAASLAADDPEEKKAIWDQAKIDTQKWYAKDKALSTQNEMLQTLGRLF